MPTDTASLRPRVSRAVTTYAATPDYLCSHNEESPRNTARREAWEGVRNTLIDWGLDPSQFDEEGAVPPAGQTIVSASAMAAFLGSRNFPAPTRVVPDAYGAVVFEFQNRDSFVSIHVHPDNTAEYRFFQNHRLRCRQLLVLENL